MMSATKKRKFFLCNRQLSDFERVLSAGQGEIAQSVFEFLTEYESRWCFVASNECSRIVKCCKWNDPDPSYEDVTKMEIECIIWHFERYDIGVIALHYVAEERITLEMCQASIQQDPRNARWFPDELCSHANLLAYIQEDGWVFGYLDPSLCTIDLARAAVKFDKIILEESWAWSDRDDLRQELRDELNQRRKS